MKLIIYGVIIYVKNYWKIISNWAVVNSRLMFTTHARLMFSTMAQSLPRKAECERKGHGANTHEVHQRYFVSITQRAK